MFKNRFLKKLSIGIAGLALVCPLALGSIRVNAQNVSHDRVVRKAPTKANTLRRAFGNAGGIAYLEHNCPLMFKANRTKLLNSLNKSQNHQYRIINNYLNNPAKDSKRQWISSQAKLDHFATITGEPEMDLVAPELRIKNQHRSKKIVKHRTKKALYYNNQFNLLKHQIRTMRASNTRLARKINKELGQDRNYFGIHRLSTIHELLGGLLYTNGGIGTKSRASKILLHADKKYINNTLNRDYYHYLEKHHNAKSIIHYINTADNANFGIVYHFTNKYLRSYSKHQVKAICKAVNTNIGQGYVNQRKLRNLIRRK